VTLPVGLDLTGRRALVVGGGPVVVEPARALVDAGARVTVLAPWVCEQLEELAVAGGLDWRTGDYDGAADLAEAWFVVVGSGDVTTDDTVRADALASRVWCLDATAPGAGTATLPATARVATPDGTVTVAAHCPGDRALGTHVVRSLDGLLTGGALDLRRRHPRTGAGWVALVGGGPGADGLLTGRARELLAAADVVVLDRLAPRGVVDRLPTTVRVVDVGKAPGRHALDQERINDLLVAEALAGHAVVRLKGGDPYVLGRGGEERAACEAHGIRVEVVPGVTSAVAVPAAAGIPVTHRGLARGFTVVTGHDELPAVPPGTDHTVVLLMGVGRLERSAQALLDTGRPAACPVAVIERGFLPEQRVTVGALGDIAGRARAVGVENPAVVVVGDVVRLSPDFPRD
jgi:uroporphyrin-III C-methyltransferase / precorrin-2 dehydrogenase / sirohydrochlorin ferrochelatase